MDLNADAARAKIMRHRITGCGAVTDVRLEFKLAICIGRQRRRCHDLVRDGARIDLALRRKRGDASGARGNAEQPRPGGG